MRKFFIAGLALTLLSTVAIAEENGSSDCAWNRRFDTWSYVDDKTIILSYSPSNKFKIMLSGRCHGLRDALAISLRSSGSCVRPGDRIVLNRRGMGPTFCMIHSIERYEPGGETSGEQENGNPD